MDKKKNHIYPINIKTVLCEKSLLNVHKLGSNV